MTPPDAPVPSERDRQIAGHAMLRDDLPDHLVTEWGANHMGGIIAECAAQARAEGYAAGFADARQLAADAVQEYVYPSGTPAPPPMR